MVTVDQKTTSYITSGKVLFGICPKSLQQAYNKMSQIELRKDLPQVDLMNFRVEYGCETPVRATLSQVLNKQDEGLFRKSKLRSLQSK